jgi:hypothetical protein
MESVGRQECDFQFGEGRTFGLPFGGGWRHEAASGRPDQAGRAFGAFGAFGRSLLAPGGHEPCLAGTTHSQTPLHAHLHYLSLPVLPGHLLLHLQCAI